MEHYKSGNLSTSSTLRPPPLRKRSRFPRKRTLERRRHSRREDRIDESDDIHDAHCSASPSSTCPATCTGVAPDIEDGGAPRDFDFDFAISADRHGRTRCIWRRNMLSLAAATLYLCCQTAFVCVGASPPLPYEALNGGSRPALFVSTVRDSLINTIIARQSLTKPSMSVQRKTPQRSRKTFSVDTTWSNAVRQKSDLNESRFGVRKRVRTVLDKAKKRTGIENGTDEQQSKGASGESSFVQTDLNIMAEAASVGGLGEVVVFEEEGSVDAALGYVSRGMGDIQPARRYDDNSASLTTIALSSYGERYEDLAVLTKVAEDDVNEAPTKNGAKLAGTTPPLVRLDSATTSFTEENDPVLQQKSDVEENVAAETKGIVETNVAAVDVSAPPSPPLEPLPFQLPKLKPEQYRRVVDGERVQYQDDMGLAGSGFVVWDVKAPASVVWDCLLDFKSYPQTIPTVREVVMYTNTHLKEDYRAERPLDFEDGTAAICKHGVPSVTRAQFLLSKFRLKVAAVHKYRVHPKGDYMIFTLDPASTNMVLKYAKGIWYTQSNPDGKEGYTRVWLLCELRVSRLLPKWIVDYAAARAMPRATTWLKPQTEAAAMLWLRESAERGE